MEIILINQAIFALVFQVHDNASTVSFTWHLLGKAPPFCHCAIWETDLFTVVFCLFTTENCPWIWKQWINFPYRFYIHWMWSMLSGTLDGCYCQWTCMLTNAIDFYDCVTRYFETPTYSSIMSPTSNFEQWKHLW